MNEKNVENRHFILQFSYCPCLLKFVFQLGLPNDG